MAVTTTPMRVLAEEPPETVSVVSEKLAPKRVETVAPEGLLVSSLMAFSVAEPEATGASLAALTVMAMLSLSESGVPAVSEERTVRVSKPLKLALPGK